MEKASVIVCLIMILFSCSNDVGYEDERVGWGLKGNVKSCLEHSYNIDAEHNTRGEVVIILSNLVTFNRKGQIKKVQYYNNEEGMTDKGYQISIREKGKTVEEIGYTEKNEIYYHVKYRHISDSIVEYEQFEEGKMTKYGKMIERGLFTEDSCTYIRKISGKEETQITLCEYNEDRNIVSKQTSYQHERYVSYKWFEYLEFDKKNNWTKAIEYYGKGRDDSRFMLVREISYY